MKHQMMTIKDMWEKYRLTVVPLDAGPNQLRDMEMCFYAGITAVMCIVTDTIPELPEEEGCKIISGYMKEIEGFAKRLVSDAIAARKKREAAEKPPCPPSS